MRSWKLSESSKEASKTLKPISIPITPYYFKSKLSKTQDDIHKPYAIQNITEIRGLNDIITPHFSITSRISNSIGKIERASAFLNNVEVSDKRLKQMQERASILEAHYTTHIEGTELNLDQSQRLLKGEKICDVRSEDVKELKNLRNAINLVEKYIDSQYPLTEMLVREVHKSIIFDVKSSTPGNYRKIQNFVSSSKTGDIIYTPPAAYQVPILMRQLIDWINMEKKVHPILVAGIAQFQLVHIHPFLDGNGRFARLLSYLILYKANYNFRKLLTISKYYDSRREDYYHAIQKTRDDNMNFTHWLDFFTLGLLSQIKELEENSTKM